MTVLTTRVLRNINSYSLHAIKKLESVLERPLVCMLTTSFHWSLVSKPLSLAPHNAGKPLFSLEVRTASVEGRWEVKLVKPTTFTFVTFLLSWTIILTNKLPTSLRRDQAVSKQLYSFPSFSTRVCNLSLICCIPKSYHSTGGNTIVSLHVAIIYLVNDTVRQQTISSSEFSPKAPTITFHLLNVKYLFVCFCPSIIDSAHIYPWN